MKYYAIAVFAVFFATAGGESLPWVEDFAGILDGEVNDSGPTSWSATRAGGIFEIKDETLWINQNGGGSEGILETGDIDVSNINMVEVSMTIHGVGDMENADYVQLWAVLDGTKRIFIGEKRDSQDSGTIVSGLLDTYAATTLNVDIRAKVSYDNEHYYIQGLSVLEAAADSDGCTYYDLNMDSLDRGDYVTNQFSTSHGVDISCSCSNCNDGGCRVFDSELPIGEWDGPGTVTECRTGNCNAGSCSKSNCGDPDLGVS